MTIKTLYALGVLFLMIVAGVLTDRWLYWVYPEKDDKDDNIKKKEKK